MPATSLNFYFSLLTHAYTDIHTPTHMHRHRHCHAYTHTHAYTDIHTPTRMHRHRHCHAYTHTHAYTDIHTPTRMRRHTYCMYRPVFLLRATHRILSILRRFTRVFKGHTKAPWGTLCRACATSEKLGSTLCSCSLKHASQTCHLCAQTMHT